MKLPTTKAGGFIQPEVYPWLIVGALWVFVMMTQGCAGSFIKPVETINVPASLPEVGKEAQKIVNEANVLLAATYRVIGSNAEAGVWTKAQAQGYQDKADGFAGQADEVQNAIDRGMWLTAKSQAELLNRLILELNKEVAAQARKAGQK